MKKRHVYAIVEGESPASTPPSTPFVGEKNKTRKNFPTIFPRNNSSLRKDLNNEYPENPPYDIAFEPNLENRQNCDFSKVTLI